MTQSVHLSRGNELWEETATDGTIGIPIFESVRRRTPPGEVGGGKTSKSLPLNSVELAKEG